MAKRLEIYLTSIGIFDFIQEGFRKGRNTVRYLHRLTAGIKGDMTKRLTVLCLFLDFEKAFDTVEHEELWNVLHKLGVEACYIEILKNCMRTKLPPWLRALSHDLSV